MRHKGYIYIIRIEYDDSTKYKPHMIKPGSLVVYIGGQYKADIDAGLGLSRDVIYEVKRKGWALLSRRQVKCIWLQERPNEHHAIGMFREVQPPGTINFEELLSHPLPKKDTRTGEDELAEQKEKAETKARTGGGG